MRVIFSSIVFVIVASVIFAQTVKTDNRKVDDTIAYIKQQTIGGKLDFSSVLEIPGEVITHDDGVVFNKRDYFVLLWAQAVAEFEVLSSDQTARLWEEIHERKLTLPQRTALRIPFENKNKQK